VFLAFVGEVLNFISGSLGVGMKVLVLEYFRYGLGECWT
jgi:hypothetical protein